MVKTRWIARACVLALAATPALAQDAPRREFCDGRVALLGFERGAPGEAGAVTRTQSPVRAVVENRAGPELQVIFEVPNPPVGFALPVTPAEARLPPGRPERVAVGGTVAATDLDERALAEAITVTCRP